MSQMRKVASVFAIVAIVFATALLFSGCSSNDSSNIKTYGNGLTYECTYDTAKDETKIKISVPMTNQSTLNVEKLTFDFKLSKSGEYIRNSGNWHWNYSIKHGQEIVLNAIFVEKGEINEIEIVHFQATFSNIWKSYEAWWIATIVLTILIIIIGAIIIVVNDLEIDEFFEWVGENWWWLFIFAPIIIPFAMNNWVSGLIIVGGCVVALVVLMLVFLIRYIISNIGLGFGGGYSVGDYNEMTVAELRDECSYRGIKGYSKMTKNELVAILENESDESNDESEIEQPKTPKATSTKTNTTKSANVGSIPKIKLADIAGLDEAKKALDERVILPLKHKEIYDKYGKSVGGGILLFGLPGTGKTMFAQAVATELDAKFFSVKCSDIQSKWYGEAEKNVKNLFAQAKKCPRAVIFFDEFDSLGGRRTEENQDGASTVQEILTQMQGVEKNNNMLLVIGATNCPWALDGALLRPGRFNEKIYIPLPDKNAILFILKKELKGCPLTSDIDLSAVADKLGGCNGADIVEFCEKIKMKLIRKEIEKGKPEINKDELTDILNKTKSSVLPRDVAQMEKFMGAN